MNENRENALPPQGSRNPRGRRGDGIVPAQFPSTSGEGLCVSTNREEGMVGEDNVKSPSSESVVDCHGETDGESESTGDSALNSNLYWRNAELDADDLDVARLDLYEKATRIPPNLKGRSREEFVNTGVDRFDAFAIGLICKLQDSYVETFLLKENNWKLRMRLEVLEREVTKVKKTVKLIERNACASEETKNRTQVDIEEESSH